MWYHSPITEGWLAIWAQQFLEGTSPVFRHGTSAKNTRCIWKHNARFLLKRSVPFQTYMLWVMHSAFWKQWNVCMVPSQCTMPIKMHMFFRDVRIVKSCRIVEYRIVPNGWDQLFANTNTNTNSRYWKEVWTFFPKKTLFSLSDSELPPNNFFVPYETL